MKDANYFRARAELCLNVARLLSDRNAAERLRVEAAENVARAVALEARSGSPVSNSSAMAGRREPLPDFADPALTNEGSKSGQPDVRNDDGYRSLIQTMIGQELGARYDLPQEIPHRILTLLMQLNEQRQNGKTDR